jgi:hypothetical protein
MVTPRRSVAGRGSFVPRFPRGLNGVDDAVITGAPAEVAGEAALDSATVSRQIPVDEVGRPYGDAGGAETALYGALTHKSTGKQLTLALGKALEGHHLGAVGAGWIQLARQGGFAVEEDGATSAHTLGCATVLDRRDAAGLPEHLEEMHSFLIRNRGCLTVELEGNFRHDFNTGSEER